MSHVAEIASGIVVAIAAVGGALIVLPRTKPEPAPAAVVLAFEPVPVQRAEPLPDKTEAERIDDLQRQLRDIAAEHKRLSDEVKAIAESERRDPPSPRLRRTK